MLPTEGERETDRNWRRPSPPIATMRPALPLPARFCSLFGRENSLLIRTREFAGKCLVSQPVFESRAGEIDEIPGFFPSIGEFDPAGQSAPPAGEIDVAESVDARFEEAADDCRCLVLDDDGGAGDDGARQ